MLNCMWMLTEFTPDNGATLILPFSHTSRRIPRRGVQYRNFVYGTGPAGSIVIFDGRIWHAGGANTTQNSHRVGLSTGYFANWMDPAAGGWYLMKRSVRDRMPAEVQKMNRRVVEG
jgi:ectoine hydroxylase-related dioxygenase (phytanoyl-CoA dioxygenase family)